MNKRVFQFIFLLLVLASALNPAAVPAFNSWAAPRGPVRFQEEALSLISLTARLKPLHRFPFVGAAIKGPLNSVGRRDFLRMGLKAAAFALFTRRLWSQTPTTAAKAKLNFIEDADELKFFPGLNQVRFPKLQSISIAERGQVRSVYDVIEEYASREFVLQSQLQNSHTALRMMKGSPRAFAKAVGGSPAKGLRAYTLWTVDKTNTIEFFIVLDPAVFKTKALMASALGHEIVGIAAHMQLAAALSEEEFSKLVKTKQAEFLEWILQRESSSPFSKEELRVIKKDLDKLWNELGIPPVIRLAGPDELARVQCPMNLRRAS